jgi:hypothetical protein
MTEELNKLSDRELMEMVLIACTANRIQSPDPGIKEHSTRLEPILRRCLENMTKVDELMKKLIDANDNLAMERSSNKRMRTLLADLAGVLHGNPVLYPAPLNDLVARIQKEFKS